MHSATKRIHVLVLLLITLLAVHLRVVAIRETAIDQPIRGDARLYLFYTYNLKQHGVFSFDEAGLTGQPKPDALSSPGYPAFAAPFLQSDDVHRSLRHIGMAQALLSTASVVLVYLIFVRVASPWAALLASLMTAISPHLINANVYLLTESLFSFLLLLFLYGLLHASRRTEPLPWLLAGLLLALTNLVRPTTQFLIIPLWIWLFLLKDLPGRQKLNMAICLTLPVVLTAGVWAMRNQLSTGRTSDPTLAANFLHHGMYPDLKYQNRPETYGYPYRFDPASARLNGRPDEVLVELAHRVAEQPATYARWFLIGKPLQFFAWDLTESVGDAFIYAPLRTPYQDHPLFRTSHAIAKALHQPLTLVAIAMALFACFNRDKPAQMLLGFTLAYFILFHMLGAPFPRYSLPTRPLVYGLAFLGLEITLLGLQHRLLRTRMNGGCNTRCRTPRVARARTSKRAANPRRR